MFSGGALAGNFLIGTGVRLPAGMLYALSERFDMPPDTAALLMLASGRMAGFGAPALTALAGRMARG